MKLKAMSELYGCTQKHNMKRARLKNKIGFEAHFNKGS